MREITLLTRRDLGASVEGPCGLLLECAPDSPIRQRNRQAISLAPLIGSFEAAKQKAAALSFKLIDGEPLIRGAPYLRIFQEILILELQQAFHAIALRDFLEQSGFRRCRFLSPSPFARALARLGALGHARLDVSAPKEAASSARLVRVWQRLANSGFRAESLGRELRQAVRTLDSSRRLGIGAARHRAARNRIWCYATSQTFSNIGLSYEPFFPEPFEFLVEDPWTGGVPLRRQGRPFSDIYAYGGRELVPGRPEVAEALDAIKTHIARVPLAGEEAVARQLLECGDFAASLAQALVPAGMLMSGLFARWLCETEPRALVVGNPGWEGFALIPARAAGIPTVLLQHGILGDFCQFVDPPAEHYVVRGEFWREFLASKPRARSIIANPQTMTASSRRSGSAILFLTAAYDLEYYSLDDLDDILGAIAAEAGAASAELIVRVHPAEAVAFYRERMGRLTAGMRAPPRITYSQGPGLDEVLSRACVAVTFCSTVFLDCLRWQVPVVSFGWHGFSFEDGVRRGRVFHFAESLEHLRELVRKATRGELEAYEGGIAHFLHVSPEDEPGTTLGRLVAPRSTPRLEMAHAGH